LAGPGQYVKFGYMGRFPAFYQVECAVPCIGVI
jgi:hypothetical protein